jgi:hypothetical protein
VLVLVLVLVPVLVLVRDLEVAGAEVSPMAPVVVAAPVAVRAIVAVVDETQLYSLPYASTATF